MARKKESIRMPEPAVITPVELQEYRLRYAAVMNTRHNAMMVEEAYNRWVADTAKKRGIVGTVSIDLQTGVITKRTSNA